LRGRSRRKNKSEAAKNKDGDGEFMLRARPEVDKMDHSPGSAAGPDAVMADLKRLSEVLEKAYRTPDFGNKVDPLDELVYLTIAQRTRIDLARKVFEELQKKLYPWDKILLPRNQATLKRILGRGGRGNLRYRAVTGILKEVRRRAGVLSLEFLRDRSLAEAEKFLLSLPWVGRKTAYCVLMYSLGHGVFPADSNIIRVFRRTKVLGPASISLEKVDHRTAQKRIAPFIPREIAYSLHVNMVVHGREVCLEGSPRCGICPVRLHCGFFRDARRKEGQNFEFTMVDLFSGAGGISYGFARAGIRPILAVDTHPPACETYVLNIPWIDRSRVLNRDITAIPNKEIPELVNHERVDILVAGVPCQGFSRVGLKTKPSLKEKRPPEKEATNRLFMEVIRWTRILTPSVVLLENVPDMGSSKILFEDSNVRVRDLLQRGFAQSGYSSSTLCLNSAEFGIPQLRRRLFFVAIRDRAIPENIEEEILEFWHENQPGAGDAVLPLRNALIGLPRLEPGTGEDVLSASDNYPPRRKMANPYEKFVYDSPYVAFNHKARQHNEDDMRIIAALQPGETYKKLVGRNPSVIAKRKKKTYSLENFHDKFYRLNAEKPCRTIVAHLARDGNSFIHPFENRAITVREAARVQTFPNSFAFTGSRTSQYLQVGNAVPPFLAMIIGSYFVGLLEAGGG
jgi:DNA (cytosine-5)-methyltransferase 1